MGGGGFGAFAKVPWFLCFFFCKKIIAFLDGIHLKVSFSKSSILIKWDLLFIK